MSLIVLVLVAMGVLLGLCMAFDFNKKEVPDILVASLWILSFYFLREQHPLLIGGFASLFFFNSAFTIATKKPFMGWADVLILPIFIVLTMTVADMFEGISKAMVICQAVILSVLPFLITAIRKRETPAIPFLGVSYIFSLLALCMKIESASTFPFT